MHGDGISNAPPQPSKATFEVDIGPETSRDGHVSDETAALLWQSDGPGSKAAGEAVAGALHDACSATSPPRSELTPLCQLACITLAAKQALAGDQDQAIIR